MADKLTFKNTQEIREEIARIVPFYEGIQLLKETGDQVQYGGPHLCPGLTFPTPDGKAHFIPIDLPKTEIPDGMFAVATRRGKQFNSMVHARKDAITGAGRDAVLMNKSDAASLGVREGDKVMLRNGIGEYLGSVWFAPIKPRNVQIHWPEGNVIIDHVPRSHESDVPDYNAFVTINRVTDPSAGS